MVKANYALNNSAQFVIVCFMVAHNCHGKTKNLTAKPKTSNSFGFAVGYIAFAVRSLVLP